MATKKPAKSNYGAESIQVLEGLDPVRKRPGMYIGTTGLQGLHHLIWEIFDNSRDEAMGGFADDIEVALLPGNVIRVVDNGRGIPVDKHAKTKVSALETIMTTLHAGGKFGGDGYKFSGGLHGVGISVMNALSVKVRAEVHRDGAYHVQEYKEGGKPLAPVKKLGKSDKHGTIITFEADPLIFPEIAYNFKTIVDHLRQQAYLVRGMRITIIDAREYEGEIADTEVFYIRQLKLETVSQTFYFDGGLKSLVSFENRYQKPLHKGIFHVEKEHEAPKGSGQQDVQVEVALQYVDDISSRVVAYANNIYNPEGGMHITGFKTALTRTINNYVKKANIKGVEGNFTGDDVLEGITAVVSVKLQEIQFEGQTKAKLGSVEARAAVDTVFSAAFAEFLEENPNEAKQIVNKSVLAMRARQAAKAAKDSVLRKGALDGMTLPGKLADCQSKSAEDSEIFIVEGDSAGGTAKSGRDRKTQAILPLRGKILNVERARLDRMLGSEQIKNVVVALGTAIGDTFDLTKLRYHKIIIATDADVDGEHIQTLMLTLFYRYFKELIDGGFLYIAQPPLYKVKKGKAIQYFYSETEKAQYEQKNGIESGESSSNVQRYKGLGEMNAEELWETTMDPERRILKQVTIEDGREADRVFDMLMGTDVPARKAFIQSHAKEATLDI
jgi:DNA gyrase subunit B